MSEKTSKKKNIVQNGPLAKFGRGSALGAKKKAEAQTPPSTHSTNVSSNNNNNNNNNHVSSNNNNMTLTKQKNFTLDERGVSNPEQFLVTELSIPCVYFLENFFSKEDSKKYFDLFNQQFEWHQNKQTNRAQVLYGDTGVSYKYYNSATQTINPWTSDILTVKTKTEELYFKLTKKKVVFNVLLANHYRDGMSNIGWHADREELGKTTPIASLSFGATRTFEVKSDEKKEQVTLDLSDGCIVFMENDCQVHYVHRIVRDPNIKDPRINLTFRAVPKD